jgi:lysozyme family protein
MAWTYEATKAGYANMWASLAIKNVKGADKFARKIIAGESKYKAVEDQTGVPWYFIGLLHMRESSNNFAGVLHNGEHIIGTGLKTKLVPRGKGPFSSWEEAAADALELKDLHKIRAWDISRIGYEAERFNGLGYTNKGINSPYLWAGSTHQQAGKYVADGKFSSTATDTQLGVMTVLKRICELRPDVAAQLGGGKPRVEYEPKPAAKSKTVIAEIVSLVSVVIAWVAENLGFITDWRFILFVVAAVSLFVIYERLSKGDIVSWFKTPKKAPAKKRKRK